MPTLVNSDAHLARLLDVDKAVVSRDKRRGMPTDSLEAARAWREKNLSVAMRKDSNPLRNWAVSKPGSPAAARAAVSAIVSLLPVAVVALQQKRFDLVKPRLQAALRAVPESARASVRMPDELWEELTAWVWIVARDYAGGSEEEQLDDAAAPPGGFRYDAFLYGAAAGEFAPSPQ